MRLTERQYYDEVKSIAKELRNAIADGEAQYDYLHELVDGHQWVIYSAYNLEILLVSRNDEYMLTELGEESAVSALKDGGLSQLHMQLAYWALYADVLEAYEELVA